MLRRVEIYLKLIEDRATGEGLAWSTRVFRNDVCIKCRLQRGGNSNSQRQRESIVKPDACITVQLSLEDIPGIQRNRNFVRPRELPFSF